MTNPFTLSTLRNFYKVNKFQNSKYFFNKIKNSYKDGDYLNFYNEKLFNIYDIYKNNKYRVHLSILENGIVEKSHLPRHIYLLEGSIFISDKYSNFNLNKGCYFLNSPNLIVNNGNKHSIVLSHVDYENNKYTSCLR